jgi:hypothetical protein
MLQQLCPVVTGSGLTVRPTSATLQLLMIAACSMSTLQVGFKAGDCGGIYGGGGAAGAAVSVQAESFVRACHL